MTDISRHCRIAISLLAVLCLMLHVSAQTPSAPGPKSTPEVSRVGAEAQVTPDLLLSLPNSDTLITIDVKRVISEVFPRVLADEPDHRRLVMSLLDLKPLIGLDLQAIDRMAVGIRYTDVQGATSKAGFSVVAIAQSSEAARLPDIMRQMGSDKFVEQQYGGKHVFVTKTQKADDTKSEGRTGFAITALNENTVVLGNEADVRACIDINAGRAKGPGADQINALKRSPRTLASAASLLPPSVTSSATQEFGSSQLSEALSSLKWVYASIEPSPDGLEFASTMTTATPEQAKSLADVWGAFITLSSNAADARTTEDKFVRELIRGVRISTNGNELQLRETMTQVMLNMLAKLFASDVYISRGINQIQLSDPRAAIAEYDKAIMLIPDNPLVLVNRGKAKADNQDPDAAIADYDKAIALAPNWSLPYNNRGFARLGTREFDAAIVDLDKAIALDPTFAFPYNNRGKAFFEKGDLEKAMADYDKSIALDPSNAFAFFNRGYARSQKGEYDAAIVDLDRAITLDPNMADAYNSRGIARYKRFYQTESGQDLNQAIDDYNKAISLAPEEAVFYVNRGYALTDKEEFKRAIDDFDKALALNPNDADAYNGRGLAHYYKEEFTQAIADYDRAIALDSGSAPYYGNRALSRLSLRLDELAAQDLKKCYEINQSLKELFEPQVKEIKKTRRAKPRRPQSG